MKKIGGKRHVSSSGDGFRFAVVDAFQLGQFVGVFQNEIADFPNEPPACTGGHRVPRVVGVIKNFTRGGDSQVNIFRIALGDLGDLCPAGGIVNGECFAGSGSLPLAVDERLSRGLQVLLHAG